LPALHEERDREREVECVYIKTFIRSNAVEGRKEEAPPRVLYSSARTQRQHRHRDCNRHHAGAIIIAMATFQHHFLFVSLVFYRLANGQITTHKKKAQMDNPPTRRTLVARVRPPSVRPLHLLHFNLPATPRNGKLRSI